MIYAYSNPRCTMRLREEGKSYPRTCEVCGLGPCHAPNGTTDPMVGKMVGKITSFCTNPETITEHLALLKVGHEKGDTPEEIMKRVLVSALLRFNKIPITPGQS